MNQIVKKCDVCKGRGSVQVFDFEHGHTAAGIGTNMSSCDKCNGTGFIETDLFVNDAGPYWGNFTINEEIP